VCPPYLTVKYIEGVVFPCGVSEVKINSAFSTKSGLFETEPRLMFGLSMATEFSTSTFFVVLYFFHSSPSLSTIGVGGSTGT